MEMHREFELRSHLPPVGREHGERYQAVCKAGSVVVFDGRIRHRGLANKSGSPRTVLYTVWHKYWYKDYGTLQNEFPHGSWRQSK